MNSINPPVTAQLQRAIKAPTTAPEFLGQAQRLLAERGKQYDQPGGERSMGKTIAAFNAITGRNLAESDGWLLMLLLKQVRQWQTPGKFHRDSAEDSVSYAALLAEALASSLPDPHKILGSGMTGMGVAQGQETSPEPNY